MFGYPEMTAKIKQFYWICMKGLPVTVFLTLGIALLIGPVLLMNVTWIVSVPFMFGLLSLAVGLGAQRAGLVDFINLGAADESYETFKARQNQFLFVASALPGALMAGGSVGGFVMFILSSTSVSSVGASLVMLVVQSMVAFTVLYTSLAKTQDQQIDDPTRERFHAFTTSMKDCGSLMMIIAIPMLFFTPLDEAIEQDMNEIRQIERAMQQ